MRLETFQVNLGSTIRFHRPPFSNFPRSMSTHFRPIKRFLASPSFPFLYESFFPFFFSSSIFIDEKVRRLEDVHALISRSKSGVCVCVCIAVRVWVLHICKRAIPTLTAATSIAISCANGDIHVVKLARFSHA